MTRNEIIARRLMEIAAAHSVNATQGWASHTCVTLSEAARLLRGEPEPKQDDNAIGVLSDHTNGAVMGTLFGDKLRVARALRDLSLRDVSEVVGVSYNAVSKYEAGKMVPSSSVLVAMANLYGVSLDWLMCPCPITLGWHEGECAAGVKRRAEMLVTQTER